MPTFIFYKKKKETLEKGGGEEKAVEEVAVVVAEEERRGGRSLRKNILCVKPLSSSFQFADLSWHASSLISDI